MSCPQKCIDFLQERVFCCFKKLRNRQNNKHNQSKKYPSDNKATEFHDDTDKSDKNVELRTNNSNNNKPSAHFTRNSEHRTSQDSTSTTNKMLPFLKLTLVGDGGVGKSCLILQYMYNEFMDEYEPTKADAYRRTITLQGEEVQIDILDTAGQEDYPAVRDGYLKHGDGFFLIFDLTNRDTFDSVPKHRDNILRVKSDETTVPVILLGNKKDLAAQRQVSYEEATKLANQYQIEYIETSALTKENVDKAFSEILIKIKERKSITANTSTTRRNSQYPKVRNTNNVDSTNMKNSDKAENTKNRISSFFKAL